jgi:hypothetical protein
MAVIDVGNSLGRNNCGPGRTAIAPTVSLRLEKSLKVQPYWAKKPSCCRFEGKISITLERKTKQSKDPAFLSYEIRGRGIGSKLRKNLFAGRIRQSALPVLRSDLLSKKSRCKTNR